MSAFLSSTATSLETAAGASTSANENDAGYWKRIAAAAEALAGATTSANDAISGYMLRAALALESIAGTTGAEENANEAGYLKRIVDALEVQSGAVVVGSLEHRLMVGAQNATFSSEPVLGPELWSQPDFDASTGLTLNGWSVAGGQADSNAQVGFLTATSPEAFIQGATYRISVEITSNPNSGSLGVNVGGFLISSYTATATQDVVYTPSPVGQLIRLRDPDEAGIVLSAFSFRQLIS